ncbi:MAG: alpha-amylase family glycosyl hydrolase [Crinalium sp.]
MFYFVLPDRFANGNDINDTDSLGGDTDKDVLRHGYNPRHKGYYHGGDIAGLRSKLNYLKGMGVTAIWMTPVFKNKPVQGDGTIAGSSSGYHGYWITDFTQIDPHLGTNEELQTLIKEAHARGMKVFFDIITNHTADVISYREGKNSYRNKNQFPYKTAQGETFDDRNYVGMKFPKIDAKVSFPYTPEFLNESGLTVKKPNWLNDPIYYHNRGNTDFQEEDEDQQYGDFSGLDDLFTENPDVTQGMIDIYKTWVDYGVDGFRIDTVKHVNIEFWQKFAPEILNHAKARGIKDFFMFGEVYSPDPAFTSTYTTKGRLQAVLDFPFQEAVRGFASRKKSTNNLRDFFAKDDYYIDKDSNAYNLPTFLGNHDMGRFGFFLKQDNPNTTDTILLARDRLAHALMYFARGIPVVYYGDEQGFTGSGQGNDQFARQDMFPTQTSEYKNEDQIGTEATPSADNFNPSHPLYRTLAEFALLRQQHKALRQGAQIHRYSTNSVGIYAFSRIAREDKVEYIVATNNAETRSQATFQTFTPNVRFIPIYPTTGAALKTDASGNLTIKVPPLGTAIFKASKPLPPSKIAPKISLRTPVHHPTRNYLEIGANLSTKQFVEVTFAVKVGDGKFVPIGTDDNAPYRVFYDTRDLKSGTPLSIKAIVNDLNGHLHSAITETLVKR